MVRSPPSGRRPSARRPSTSGIVGRSSPRGGQPPGPTSPSGVMRGACIRSSRVSDGAGPHGWGDSASRSGEIQASVIITAAVVHRTARAGHHSSLWPQISRAMTGMEPIPPPGTRSGTTTFTGTPSRHGDPFPRASNMSFILRHRLRCARTVLGGATAVNTAIAHGRRRRSVARRDRISADDHAHLVRAAARS